MTIFQKMLFVPILSVALFACFITYSYFEQQQSNEQIKELRRDYVPVIEITNENKRLFKVLQTAFKDAVLAKESLWIKETILTRELVNQNLDKLKNYTGILDSQSVVTAKTSFNLYYDYATELANQLLNNNEQWQANEQLLLDIETYQQKTSVQLESLKQSVQQQFKQTLFETQKRQSQLLFWGGVIALGSMILLLVVTLKVSYNTRSDVFELIRKTKELAQGSTDFSKRIERTSRDELSYLIHWFNKLTDKLEQDYLAIKAISITDKLTQLNNRNRTDQFLPNALAEANSTKSPLAIVIIDIDHFKQVNDTFGHLTGDNVLIQFAQTIKAHASNHDYISRWGGEEFLLIWPNTNAVDAAKKSEQLRTSINQMEVPEVGAITASFGIAMAQPDDDIKSIVARADDNLYEAKENGRNRVVMDKEIALL